jgi:hypothetical protein
MLGLILISLPLGIAVGLSAVAVMRANSIGPSNDRD